MIKLRYFLITILLLIFGFAGAAEVKQGAKDEKKDEQKISKTQEEAAPVVKKEEAKPEEEAPKAAEDDQEFNIKLRNLEEKINSLKDKIFRAKQRLSILQETVLSGAIAGARASVVHKNTDVGSTFKLVSMIYYLDDAPIYKKIDSQQELEKPEIVVFDGSVVPGPHHVSVYLVYEGRGFGIFSYMEGYSLKLKAGYSFNVEEGQIVEVSSMPKDKGSTVKLDNRLYMSFDVGKKMYEKKSDDNEKGKDGKLKDGANKG